MYFSFRPSSKKHSLRKRNFVVQTFCEGRIKIESLNEAIETFSHLHVSALYLLSFQLFSGLLA